MVVAIIYGCEFCWLFKGPRTPRIPSDETSASTKSCSSEKGASHRRPLLKSNRATRHPKLNFGLLRDEGD